MIEARLQKILFGKYVVNDMNQINYNLNPVFPVLSVKMSRMSYDVLQCAKGIGMHLRKAPTDVKEKGCEENKSLSLGSKV